MKRLILALFIVAMAIVPARAEERIQRFISDVDVQRNGDLLVTETIEIWAEGRQVKRGILRDFPTVYHRTDGSRVEVGFTVQDVTRDGAAEAFATEKMANGMRVRIGSASRSVNTGTHTYVIRYRTTRQIGFFDGFDELYWNATGNGWTFPIDLAKRASICRTRSHSSRARFTPDRRARVARMPASSSSSPAASSSAPQSPCRSPTG